MVGQELERLGHHTSLQGQKQPGHSAKHLISKLLHFRVNYSLKM